MRNPGGELCVRKPRLWRAVEGRLGQVIVEMLLILPVFFMIIFLIMEMGNVAFQMILINHATWEVARIEAMLATPKGGGEPNLNSMRMQSRLEAVIKTAKVHKSSYEGTVYDRQAEVMNKDLVLTTRYPIPLIFPISNFILSKPKGSGHREVFVTVRMPIERPLAK